MRIVSGTHKGIIINPPKGLPVRPTTDRAKESLFNILENNFNFNNLHCLDLFSGTGNVAYEFCSRGATKVISVDLDFGCVNFIKETAKKHQFSQLKTFKKNAFTFIQQCDEKFDIIFADAPYALDALASIPEHIFNKQLLNMDGWLIVEHQSNLDLSQQKHFFDCRKYGQSAFSFFKHT
ncbi:MAG: RsmD family RNA methyltransferase [Bacteroidota bacterium]